uniref:class B sortase n=1 Tax=Blautia faecicola TaxID=2509240 RepID=UPI00352014FA
MSTGRKVLFCLFAILFVGALTYGGLYIHSQREREKVYQDMETEKDPVETEEEKVQMTETEDIAQEETVKPDIPVDFEKLQKENPDIYAWITIPDTEIDYPVLQSESDDTYYLNHTVEKKKGLPGSIYSESQNRKDFSDPNTVLYGHNMKNGSMFAGLHKFSDEDYMTEHQKVIIYTPEHILTYKVFAAVVYDNRHILNCFDYSEISGKEEFLQSLKDSRNLSNIYIDTNIDEGDRLLTLSTCNSNTEQRFIVEAVLTDEQ